MSRRIFCALAAPGGGIGLAQANVGLSDDIIACPGLDYCNLANARSIPVAQRLSRRFQRRQAPGRGRRAAPQHLGLHQCLRPSPCRPSAFSASINGATVLPDHLGGSSADDASIGKIVGPAFSTEQVVDAVESIIDTYLEQRQDRARRFIDTYRRVGMDPFKEKLYGNSQARRPAAE